MKAVKPARRPPPGHCRTVATSIIRRSSPSAARPRRRRPTGLRAPCRRMRAGARVMADDDTEPMIHEDSLPGSEAGLEPKPDWDPRYKGSGRLRDKVAIVTGADSGI